MSDTDKLSKPPARDPRMDKAIDRGLSLATTLALSVGAWFINGLTTRMEQMNVVLTKLGTQVVVLEESGKRSVIAEAQLAEQRLDMATMKERVRALEQAQRRNPQENNR